MMKFALLFLIVFCLTVFQGSAIAQDQPPETLSEAPADPSAVMDPAVTETVPPQGQEASTQTTDTANPAAEETAPTTASKVAEPAPVIMPANSNPDNILNPITDIERALSEQLMYLNPQINVNRISSLFLSDWEHDLITDARMGLTTSGPLPVPEAVDSGIRDITLGGIVFRSSNDWTIWLNNARVTPTAIPTQVMDIKVYKEYIELEWLDPSKNLIYPIRLRAHQRFNLDTRMFLPGQ